MDRLALPDWFERDLFVYPPLDRREGTSTDDIRGAWRSAFEERTAPLGLYVHIPAELACVPQPDLPGGTHPYLRCLQHEAQRLIPAGEAPFANVYIGGGSRGALTTLPAEAIDALLTWLHDRFDLSASDQFTAEIDALLVDQEKAALLKRHGVNRITTRLPLLEDERDRLAFARGVRRCRKAGIRAIDVDLKGPWKDRAALEADAALVAKLKPDSVNLPFGISPPEKDGPPVKNTQLCQMRELRGAILGLGSHAVSYAGRRLVYAKAGGFFLYVRTCLRGGALRYTGGPVSQAQAMRGRLIAGLGEDGYVDREAFREAFASYPEEAFPEIFDALLRKGMLIREGARLKISAADKAGRLTCAAALFEEKFLPTDSAAPVETGATTPAQAPQELMDAAIAAYGSGDAAAALRKLDECLRAAPGDPNALMTRSAVHAGMKDPGSARSDIDAVITPLEKRLAAGGEPWESGASLPARRLLADALSSRAGLRPAAEARADIELALLTAPADWPRAGECAAQLCAS
ncbi:MAG: hypothetical protein ABIJ96_12095 [Elusimicrobiota bacterium]